ncbi:MAG: hypothetical protein AAF682_20120 [Planctomycetota bacterium]
MEGGTLLEDWWTKISQDFVPYLNVTTQLEDSPDQGLLGEKGGNGFPTLYFMEPETGAVLNDWWWPDSEETVRSTHDAAKKKAADLVALMKRAEANKDDAALQAGLKIKLAMMYAGDTPLEELGRLAETEGLDAGIKAEFDAWYGGRMVASARDEAGKTAKSREEFMEKAGAAMYGLLKGGLLLPVDHEAAQDLYGLGLEGAVAAGDKEIAMLALEHYEKVMNKMVEDNPRYEEQIKAMIEEAKGKVDGLTSKEA